MGEDGAPAEVKQGQGGSRETEEEVVSGGQVGGQWDLDGEPPHKRTCTTKSPSPKSVGEEKDGCVGGNAMDVDTGGGVDSPALSFDQQEVVVRGTKMQLRMVLERSPKWGLVQEILQEIQEQQSQIPEEELMPFRGSVLVVTKEERAAIQLRKCLSEGEDSLLERNFRNHLARMERCRVRNKKTEFAKVFLLCKSAVLLDIPLHTSTCPPCAWEKLLDSLLTLTVVLHVLLRFRICPRRSGTASCTTTLTPSLYIDS